MCVFLYSTENKNDFPTQMYTKNNIKTSRSIIFKNYLNINRLTYKHMEKS